MSMTPLIDVIFLLLLFFMLTSTFSKYGEIELSNAVGGSTTSATPTERLFLQLGSERLVLNGQTVSLNDLETQLEAGQVLVSLDPDTTAQRVIDVLVRLRGRDGLSVLVLE
ncbi:Biopolymer transport protein ExbD/TolR [Ruegeria atlantica]|uniref:Biopolymer transport protein ExbD/TolR n=2 Tax=Ruegeria atlantica TaxID=81569 RepID=A0A0N7LR40_9RHOB|nr:Biopolymer transport protein ExbD/TolR [Ruegeria atlantica]